MKTYSRYLSIAVCFFAMGCVVPPANQTNNNAGPLASPASSPLPVNQKAANAQPLTLPVLDAFFADEGFSELLKRRLQLTDDQVTQLRQLAHAETAKLNEASAGTTEGETAAARATAEEKISAVIGKEKTQQLATLVGEQWGGANENTAETESSG